MHHGGKIAKRVTRLSIAQQDTDKQRPEELRTGLQVLVTKYRTKQRGRRSSRRRKFIIISDNCLASVFPLSCEGCPQNAERNRERKKERGVNYWLVERKKEIIYKQCSKRARNLGSVEQALQLFRKAEPLLRQQRPDPEELRSGLAYSTSTSLQNWTKHQTARAPVVPP